MKKLIALVALLFAVVGTSQAQFTPGQILTAAELNAQFALQAKLAGATFTGPVTIPNLTVSSSANVGSMSLVTALPVSSGGTGVKTASGTALDNITGFSSTGVISRTGAGTYAFGTVPPTSLSTQAANTVLANVTASTASPTAAALPSCSTSTSALQYTSGTGFSCYTNSASLTGATFTGHINVSYSGASLFTNDTSGTNQYGFGYQSNGTAVWATWATAGSTGSWILQRYVSGTATDNPISVANSTGLVTFADGITSSGTNTIAGYAPLASPAFTGTPTAPTATAGTSTTQLATTAFVATSYAPLASPTFTGTPAAPTASTGNSTTQIATTQFVNNEIGGGVAAGSFTNLTASGTLTGFPGRLIGVQVITATQTYTQDTGTNSVIVECVGGGGAGGGSAANSASNYSLGSGGGAGGYTMGRFTASYNGVTVTIGAAGTGSAGAVGGNGGATSFGSLLAANGGTGGALGGSAATTTAYFVMGSAGGTVTTAGNIKSKSGAMGGRAFGASSATGAGSGDGASSELGTGGIGVVIGNNGNAATGKGAGGGGAAGTTSDAARAGGNATAGECIIYEFS